MGMYKRFLIGSAALTLLAAGVAPEANAQTAARKAGRGLAAITTGFLEVPGNMRVETRRHGPGYGIPVGFVKGLGDLVVRELVGVYELVSSPVEIPRDFRPILQPEYPWGYFDDEQVAMRDDDFPRDDDDRPREQARR